MRLIDADALITDIEETIAESGCVNHEGEIMDCIRYASEVDAVPVVRCGDCKHYQTDVLFNSNYCCGRRRKPDDYCSYGERKESEGGT